MDDALSNPFAVGSWPARRRKAIGITGATRLVARCTRANLGDGTAWIDVPGPTLPGGIGFRRC